MRSAFALRIISGKIILNFGVQKRLRAFLNPIFTGERSASIFVFLHKNVLRAGFSS